MEKRILSSSIAIPFALLIGLLGQPFPMTGTRLSAQTPEASDSRYLYREVEKLYEKGRYDEAITLGERLLGLREKEVGQQNPEIAKILLRLASLYRATSVSDKAESYYRRAIAIGEKSFGPNHRSVGAALERYSCLLRRKARDVEAEKLQSRVLSILTPLPAGFRSGPVNGTVIEGKRISLPKPSYPAQAREMGISGTVSVLVLIDETGKPITACTTSGPEILALSAEDMAFKARWTPTTLNKMPVKVNGRVDYDFEP